MVSANRLSKPIPLGVEIALPLGLGSFGKGFFTNIRLDF